MKKFKSLLALLSLMTMFAGQIQAQEYYVADDVEAYDAGQQSSYMSAAIPLGALAIAAILIATTSRHHHGNSSDNYSSYSHSHYY